MVRAVAARPPEKEKHDMSDVTVGLFVRIEAMPGKEEDVAGFLTGALALANEEPDTTAWFAIRMGPSTFGVFDAFPGDAGRDAHLGGPIAAALMDSVGTLVEEPTIDKVDVLAAKL
jgi:quinol monooxygenase YgiN